MHLFPSTVAAMAVVRAALKEPTLAADPAGKVAFVVGERKLQLMLVSPDQMDYQPWKLP